MKNMKKILAVVVALLITGALVLGCAPAPAAEEVPAAAAPEDITIGVSLPTKELARCLKDEQYLTENFDKMGYKYDVQFAQGDIVVQNQQIENMITSGVDFLIISPMDSSGLTKVVELAHENGIPVLAYDALILNTEYIDYYVTDNLREVGATQARYIEEALGLKDGKGPFNLEIVAGDPADANAPYFYGGAYDVLAPYIENGQLVVQSGQVTFDQTSTPGWDPMKAQARVDDILNAFYSDKRVDAVLCSNDGMALGTISALKSAGYGTPDLPLPVTTGQDCDIASIKSIIAGEQTSTVFKDISKLAANAAYVADAILKGEKPDTTGALIFNNGVKDVETIVVQPLPLDITNYKELLLDSGFYTEADLQ